MAKAKVVRETMPQAIAVELMYPVPNPVPLLSLLSIINLAIPQVENLVMIKALKVLINNPTINQSTIQR